tara:strand:- start:1527 stop:2792 length:1266 start_codon:yes stop_codon:yes gene_type:complete
MSSERDKKKIESTFFNAGKLGLEGHRNRAYVDGSDALANLGYVVDFTHVPTGRQLFFKAFIVAYNETFSPDWSEETVYGRMDPIYQFKNTTRSITMNLKIPAATSSEAFENLAKVQALTQFLYPNYYDVGSATTIAQSPILRLGVMNLVRDQTHWSPTEEMRRDGYPVLEPGEGFTDSMGTGRGTHAGVLGVLKSLTINHNLETDAGVIERGASAGDVSSELLVGGSILPKLIEINFDFSVIHEHPLGWDNEGNFSNEAFPYGVDYESGQHAATRSNGSFPLATEEKWALASARQRTHEEEENKNSGAPTGTAGAPVLEEQNPTDNPARGRTLDTAADEMALDNDLSQVGTTITAPAEHARDRRIRQRQERRGNIWKGIKTGVRYTLGAEGPLSHLGVDDLYRAIRERRQEDGDEIVDPED